MDFDLEKSLLGLEESEKGFETIEFEICVCVCVYHVRRLKPRILKC